MSGFPKNISRVGAYVVKAAESRPTRVSPRSLSPGESLPKPTEEDKAMAQEMLRVKRKGSGK